MLEMQNYRLLYGTCRLDTDLALSIWVVNQETTDSTQCGDGCRRNPNQVSTPDILVGAEGEERGESTGTDDTDQARDDLCVTVDGAKKLWRWSGGIGHEKVTHYTQTSATGTASRRSTTPRQGKVGRKPRIKVGQGSELTERHSSE